MKGLENELYLIAYMISNAVAIILLTLAFKYHKIARVLFAVLFGWASWINWQTSLNSPQSYLEYADFAMLDVYRHFIEGWFSKHVSQMVPVIATCQGLIAIGLLLKGWLYQAACLGAIVFLLAIMPLGVGSGFPCTFIMAVAMALLFRKQHSWVWQIKKGTKPFMVAVD